ncbi:RHS repeat-associated core domain-containing protein [Lentisphaerota bacterium WC36G]|nr:RHS repeat-associated core domain-containing protein [Lentisphaerae bacterium WC36]
MNNGSISDRFVWLGDNLLALEKNGVAFNYIADGNKNITQLVNLTTGEIANKYDYSPFGQLAKTDENVENSFKFSSEYAEKETGLIYYNYRYYNPVNGKWLSRDPIQEKGGMNVYGFVNNNIINKWDKLGQIPQAYLGLIAAITGALANELSVLANSYINKMGKCDKGCPTQKDCKSCCDKLATKAAFAISAAYASGITACTLGAAAGFPFLSKTLFSICFATVTHLHISSSNGLTNAYRDCKESCEQLKS